MSRSLSVRALDLYLNRRILASENASAENRWWHVKIRAKRLLALTADRDVPRLARRILAILRPPTRRPTLVRRLAA